MLTDKQTYKYYDIYMLHRHHVFNYANAIVSDIELAEKITKTVFVKLYNKRRMESFEDLDVNDIRIRLYLSAATHDATKSELMSKKKGFFVSFIDQAIKFLLEMRDSFSMDY